MTSCRFLILMSLLMVGVQAFPTDQAEEESPESDIDDGAAATIFDVNTDGDIPIVILNDDNDNSNNKKAKKTNLPFFPFPSSLFGSSSEDFSFDLNSFFGVVANDDDQHEEEEDPEHKCLVCRAFHRIKSQIKSAQEQIDAERKRKEEAGEAVDGKHDINNNKYTEKVLPDGTIVKINRTVVGDLDSQDGDDDGHGESASFFFKSTSVHNILGSAQKSKDEQEDKEVEVEEDDEGAVDALTDAVDAAADAVGAGVADVDEEEKVALHDIVDKVNEVFDAPADDHVESSEDESGADQ